MFTLTPVVRNLLLINIGMIAIPSLIGNHQAFNDLLGMHSFYSPRFNPLQLISYMFLHADTGHIFFNMLGLVMFGSNLERIWGAQRFLIFYMVCGIGAGLLYGVANAWELHSLIAARDAFSALPDPDNFAQYLRAIDPDILTTPNQYLDLLQSYSHNPGNPDLRREALNFVTLNSAQAIQYPMVGASGAVYGILMAFGLLFPNAEVFLYFFPVKARYAVVIFGVMSLFGAIRHAPGDNIAHYAHLGGMVFGYLMVRF